MKSVVVPLSLQRPLSITIRTVLALALVVSSLALPAQFIPSVFAGDNDHPLQIRYQGTCADDDGLQVVAFGLGTQNTNLGDSDPTDASEPLNGYFVVTGIPAGSTIEDAWLYWNGSDTGNTFDDDPTSFNPAINDGDPTVELNGVQVGNPTPNSYGGPAFVRTLEFSYGYRADVTSIVTGNGNYALTGIDSLNNYLNGAELIVVYSKPTIGPNLIGIAEGLDVMIGSSAPLSGPGSKAVVYQFDPAQVARTITVTVGVGGAGFPPGGPIDNTFWYTTGVPANLPATPGDTSIVGLPGAVSTVNPFNGENNQQFLGTGPNPVINANGLDWDHYQIVTTIPAGNSWFAVQVQSDDNGDPQQLEWLTSTMETPLACPEYTITKTRTSPDFVQVGEPVLFDIVVANVGNTDIVTATLQDTYNTTYLTYGNGGNFSTPIASDDNLNDGQIDWGVTPTDQGIGPIPYGQSKTITVRFTAAASTQAITGPPVDRTVNTATVVNLADENGTTAPSKNDDDNVSITNPAVTVEKTLIAPADGSTVALHRVQWNIRVTNSGDTTLTTVPLVDTYDTTYLTYGFSGSFSSPASDDNIDDGTLNWADITGAGTLAPGAFIDVTVNMSAKLSTQALANDQTINTATVTGALDANGDTAPTASDTEPVEIGRPSLAVTKTLLLPADGSTAVDGQVQWRIRVTNNGDTILTTVPLADTYSTTYLTYGFSGSFSSPASNDNLDDGTLNWTDITGAGTLAPTAFVDVIVNMTAKASTQALANDQTINTGTVTGAVDENGDTAPTHSHSAPVEIGAPALTVVKTLIVPADGSAAVDGQVQWNIRVTNSGDTALTTVPLADTYDTTYLTYGFGGNFSSPASIDNNNDSTLNWTDITGIFTLAPGAFLDVTVNMTAKASTQALANDQTINTGTVTGAVDENGETAATDSDTEPVEIGAPQVSVEKTLLLPADGSTAVNGQVQWRIRVTNNGDTVLNTVPLADTYSTTYLTYGFSGSFSSPASNDNLDDGTLNWTDITGAGTLAPTAFVDVIVNMTAKASTQALANDETINTGTVTGAVDENGDTAPTDSDTAPVEIGAPTVTVVKTLVLPADGSAAVNGQVQWNIRVTNSGDTVLDTVPLADTYSTTYLTYGFSGSFSSPASIDNTDDGTLNWTDITGAGTLAPGAFIDVTVNMTAKASTQALANDQTINTGTVTGAVDENGETAPTGSDTEPVEIGAPAVTVLKTLVLPADGSAAVNGQVQWNIRVTNNGDTILTTVPLADTYSTTYLTYGFSGSFSSPASIDNTDDGTLNWTDITGAGTLAPGAFLDVTVNMTAKASTQALANDQTINTGTVTGAVDENGDTAPTDSDTAPVEIGAPAVTVEKTLVLPADGSAAVNGQVQWNIRVTNSGDTALTTVPLADIYNTTYLTYGFGGNFSSPASIDNTDDGILNWTDITGAGTLAPGAFLDVTVNMTAKASTQALANDQTINTGTVTGAVDENGETAATDSDTEPVEIGAPQVSVEKTLLLPADGSTAVNGQVQWRIRVTNNGDTVLNTVPLADTYSTTYLTYGFSGSFSSPASNDNLDDGTLNWTDITGAGTLAPTAFVDVIVNMTAKASTQALANDETINTGTVTGAVDENGDTAPTDSDTAPVEVGDPEVTVVKTLLAPAGGVVVVNGQVQWRIRVTNSGDTALATVPLADTYDTTYLTYGFSGSFSSPASIDNTDDGTLNWTDITGAGTLAPGAFIDVTVNMTAKVSTQALVNDQTINTGTVAGAVDENGETVPTKSDTEPVEIAEPGVQIVKILQTPASGPALVGDAISFDIVVTNSGDTALTTVVLTDTFDTAFLSFVNAVPVQNSAAPAGTLTWNNIGSIAANTSVTVTVNFIAVASTVGESNNETLNRTGVSQVVDENGNPVPDEQAEEPVQIVRPGAIGDYVWHDANHDGIQDVTEPGVGNVTIELRDINNGEAVVATTQTDADGGYLFPGLLPGDYRVVVTDANNILAPLGLVPSPGPESQVSPLVVNLSPEEVERDADFGYANPPGPTAIGDKVWYDQNQNGFVDPGESGIPGVTVQLYDAVTNAAVGAPVTTNANGDYLIVGAPAGTYYVQTTAGVPGGATPSTGAPDPTSVFVISAGDTYLDADIGFVLANPGQIGDLVWIDANRNGVNNSEAGVPGVSVSLIDATNGNTLATDTTDTNGNYLFTGLPVGQYIVKVTDTQNVLADYEPTIPGAPNTNNNNQVQPYAVPVIDTAAPGFNVNYADFGYHRSGPGGGGDPAGVIGNQVFYDADGDGVYNPANGDTGIAGLTVELLNAAGNTVITSTITGASGDYVFTGLITGTYQVRVADPLGILNGYVNTKFPVNQTADNNNKVQAYSVTLPTWDSFNMTADFGYTRPSAIGDFVWYDADNDGIQDVGEPGISNVTLELWNVGPNGVPGGGDDFLADDTVTDADGGYLFDDVEPGTYFVRVTDANAQLAGLTPTVGPQSQPSPDSNPFTVTPGDVEKDADFGYVLVPTAGNAIIGDTVFYDGNGDGIQQPGEPGIPNIVVCANPGSYCDITDANGNYRLDVPPGTYNVAPTNPPPAGSGYVATTPVPQPVTVVAGEQYLDADFGYENNNNLLGVIGNQVWDDLDKDGNFDGGEPGIAGVSVDLIRDTNNNGVWNDGEPIIATDTTDTNGVYQFSGVPAGNYLVHVSDTNSVLLDYVKSPNGPAGDNTSKADPYRVVLLAGGSNQTADFGYYQANRNDIGYLGNQVWTEMDYNGLFDENGANSTDKGQPGVTVDLYRNGVYYDTTTTGASGDYAFLALPSGVYTVTVTDTANVLAIYSPTTFPVDQVSDNTNKIQPYQIALPPAGENMTADFGYIAFVQIGDMAFFDSNGNGVQDSGETVGVPGVPVTATNLSLSLVFTTTTDATGIYTFTDVPPGLYQISSPAQVGIVLRTTPPANLLRFVPPGAVDLDFDIGYVNPTAVEIVQITHAVGETGITLNWSTGSEEPGDGFLIYRSLSESGERTLLTPDAIPTLGIPTGSSYEYLDASATPGEVYYYWLVTDPQGIEYGPVVVSFLTPGSGRPIYIPFVLR